MNFGSVFFRHTQNGWRVTFIHPRPPVQLLNGFACRSLFDNELVITGFIPKSLREGQFCKRPHKVINVKEFRK